MAVLICVRPERNNMTLHPAEIAVARHWAAGDRVTYDDCTNAAPRTLRRPPQPVSILGCLPFASERLRTDARDRPCQDCWSSDRDASFRAAAFRVPMRGRQAIRATVMKRIFEQIAAIPMAVKRRSKTKSDLQEERCAANRICESCRPDDPSAEYRPYQKTRVP